MPTLDQILQAIAYDAAILVDGTVNKISRVIYNGRIIWPVQNTGESIKRVIFNGRIPGDNRRRYLIHFRHLLKGSGNHPDEGVDHNDCADR